MNKTGFGIALAWPATYCKQAGAWYDGLLNILGIAKNNYYRVGHAALVLVDTEDEKCYYFDFGRYHAPFKMGRVRGEETDTELKLKTKPVFSTNKKEITNYQEILDELQSSNVFHGEGDLLSGYTPVNFKKAFTKAMKMQKNSPLYYGPFQYGGSNCSRFVNTVIRAGNPPLWENFKLYWFNPLTPTPALNTRVLSNWRKTAKKISEHKFTPVKLNKNLLSSTLGEPEKHISIPENAFWLGGEGAGSWFVFEEKEGLLHAERLSPDGTKECGGLFKNSSKIDGNFLKSAKILYPSTCKEIWLEVDNKAHLFERMTSV